LQNVRLHLELHQNIVTRGHSLKLVNSRCNYDLKKYFFAISVFNIQNSLPDSVISANNVNTLKKQSQLVVSQPRIDF